MDASIRAMGTSSRSDCERSDHYGHDSERPELALSRPENARIRRGGAAAFGVIFLIATV